MTRGNTAPVAHAAHAAPPSSHSLPAHAAADFRLPTTHYPLLTLVTSSPTPSADPCLRPTRNLFSASHRPVTLSLTLPVLRRHLGRLVLSHVPTSRAAYPIHGRRRTTYQACRAPPRPPPSTPLATPPRRKTHAHANRPIGPRACQVAESRRGLDPSPHRPVGLSGLAWRPPVRTLLLTEAFPLSFTSSGKGSSLTGWAPRPRRVSSNQGLGLQDVPRGAVGLR